MELLLSNKLVVDATNWIKPNLCLIREPMAILDDDIYSVYEDKIGMVGEPGEVYSLEDFKYMWNSEKDSDPVMKQYVRFEDWFDEISDNF